MRAAALLAALLVPAALTASPFGAAAIPDGELATMRGGIRLPNGLDVSVGIAIETRVDGQLALRTVTDGEGRIQIFSGGEAAMSPQGGTAAPPAAAGPMITINRNGAGTVVTPAMTMPNVQVAVSRGSGAPPAAGTPLPVEANGAGVATGFGTVTLEQTARGTTVVLSDPTLQIRHLIGSATGVVVANTADNRAIDTAATVNVDLAGATPLVGSNLLSIDNLAADAAARNPFR